MSSHLRPGGGKGNPPSTGLRPGVSTTALGVRGQQTVANIDQERVLEQASMLQTPRFLENHVAGLHLFANKVFSGS